MSVANALSPNGADRKRPAGEMMWRHDAVNAIRRFVVSDDGTTLRLMWYNASTATRWERIEIKMPVNAFLMTGESESDEKRTAIGIDT